MKFYILSWIRFWEYGRLEFPIGQGKLLHLYWNRPYKSQGIIRLSLLWDEARFSTSYRPTRKSPFITAYVPVQQHRTIWEYVHPTKVPFSIDASQKTHNHLYNLNKGNRAYYAKTAVKRISR